MKIEDCRKEIDEIDGAIVSLLNRRAKAAKEIGKMKAKAGLPIIDLERESEVMQNILDENEGVLHEWQIAVIYQKILDESRQVQINAISEMMRAGEIAR
jgi:chorismate mutase